MEELLISLFDHQYIRIEAGGLTPEELLSTSIARIKSDDLPLPPVGKAIEGGSDFKSLLTDDLKENELPRKWSYWKTVDPVALYKGQLV